MNFGDTEEENECIPKGYYVPHISEFRFGFEYEVYVPGTDTKYEKQVFSAENAVFIENTYGKKLESAWVRRKIPVQLLLKEQNIPVMKDFKELDKDDKELYSKIEQQVIYWNNDGTKTAGELTRRLMCIINPDLCKKD